MIRVAIVEDDAEVQGVLQEYVRRYTRQYGTEFEVTVFADGVDILEDYRAVYDIIFLDVEMKHLDGMTTAERIRQMDADVILIFITNMAQYAIRGYSVGALDYVLKPVPYFAFSQQLLKAVARLEKRAKHYLTVPVEGGLRRLDTASIYYLESEGHRVHFYTDEGDFSALEQYVAHTQVAGGVNVCILDQSYHFRCSLSSGISPLIKRDTLSSSSRIRSSAGPISKAMQEVSTLISEIGAVSELKKNLVLVPQMKLNGPSVTAGEALLSVIVMIVLLKEACT